MDKNGKHVKNRGNCLIDFLIFLLCIQNYKTGMEYQKCVNFQQGISGNKTKQASFDWTDTTDCKIQVFKK